MPAPKSTQKRKRQSLPISLPEAKKPQIIKTPSDIFNRDIRCLRTLLSTHPYNHDNVQEITQPLLAFQQHVWQHSDTIDLSVDFLETLHKIFEAASNYTGMLKQALSREESGPSGNQIGRLAWPFTPRSLYNPMVDFSRLLQSVIGFDEDQLLTRMKLACQRLELCQNEHRDLLRKTRKMDDRLKSLVRKHRAQVQLLLAREVIKLKKPMESLSAKELQDLVNDHIDELDCQVYSLEDLHRNHNCETCKKNKSKKLGKYDLPPDGLGTTQIPGLFPKGPVSVEDVEKHNFRYVTGGTTVGMMRSPETDQQELALFIWSPDYFEQTPERAVRLERLAYLIYLGANHSSICESNGPQLVLPKHLRGTMGVSGQRRDYSSAKIPWGPYAIPARFKGEDQRKEYVDFQKEFLPELATILNMLFIDSIGGLVAKSTHQYLANFKLPPLDAISINQEDWNDALGCNITWSWGGFSNECHLDKDKHRYVYSAYVFVHKDTGELVTDAKRIARYMKGGYLIWPDLHLALKIVHCTGVVLLFWRGTHERHCTITSEILDDGIVRYGTSIQVNKRLFDSVQKYHSQLEVVERWEMDGGIGPCPPRPALPTDLGDLSVGFK